MKEKFKPTKEESIKLKLLLISEGFNDGQISDIFQGIETESDYNKFFKK